jgi:amidase
MDDLIWRDASAQAEAIRTGAVSAVELLDAYLARIDALDGTLRAFVTVDREGAKAAAVQVDERLRNDPALLPAFAGVPASIKDTDDVAGMPTTHSCALLADHLATEDSPIAARVRSSGAIMLGKSNMPEFCTSITNSRLNGICRNPWDLGRTAGGSSGGAAAALAAGLCAISHGTDGAGSIRTPASWCGLVGLKPSRGMISFGPELDHPSYSTSTHGVLARSIRDAAAMLDHLAARPWTPARPRNFIEEVGQRPEQLRIGLCSTFPVGGVDADVAAAVGLAGRLCEELGHGVQVVEPDWTTILSAAALPMYAPSITRHVALADIAAIEPRNQTILRRELELTTLDHYRLIQAARAARARFLELWSEIDVLIAPVAGIVAPPVDWAPWDQTPEEHMRRFMDFANFAMPFNLTGQPALSIPLTSTSEKLPVGVQLMARPLEEALLFRLGSQIEEASPWIGRMADVAGRLEPALTGT